MFRAGPNRETQEHLLVVIPPFAESLKAMNLDRLQDLEHKLGMRMLRMEANWALHKEDYDFWNKYFEYKMKAELCQEGIQTILKGLYPPVPEIPESKE